MTEGLFSDRKPTIYYDPFNGKQTACMACGVVQDMKNGTARGQCGHCYVGYLEGWSQRGREVCRYKGCGAKAVAIDGKWPVCKTHLLRRRPDFICTSDAA